jgi:ribose-phosphate pyrophosphokinase
MNRSQLFFILNDQEWFECMPLQKGVLPVHVIHTRFQNGEFAVRFIEEVAHKKVFLLKRFSSHVHEDIFELLQCVDTLHRMGAQSITLVLPHYPYARQDHSAVNESKGGLLLAKILANLGVSKIVTIDMHAPEQLRDFPLKVVNLTTERFWANYLRALGHNSNEIQMVAADKGAVSRAQQIASALNCSWGYVHKRRYADGEVQVTEVSGFCPEKQTFLVDDLIDTGCTLIAAAQALRNLSPQPITACITHCHLTTRLLSRLTAHDISQLIITDTLKQPSSAQTQKRKVTLLNILPMLLEGL